MFTAFGLRGLVDLALASVTALGALASYPGHPEMRVSKRHELDLRQDASWCHQHHLRLLHARRADVECFARDLETRGCARATITRRLDRRGPDLLAADLSMPPVAA